MRRREQDGASRRWGEPALQKMERWLSDNGTAEMDAFKAVQGIWTFYSFTMIPKLPGQVDVGITGKVQDALAVNLYPIVPYVDQGIQSRIERSFGEFVQQNGIVSPRMDLTFVTRDHRTSEVITVELARQTNGEFIGVFTDNLKSEVNLLLPGDERAKEQWWKTFNMPLGGVPDSFQKADFSDQGLRQLVLERKNNNSEY